MCLTLWAYLPLRSAGVVYEDQNWLHALGLDASWSLTLTSQFVGADPWAHHAVNLVIHLANGLLLALCASTVYGSIVGFLASAIFLLHPLNSEAVSYVAARGELLSAFWLLCAIWIVVSFDHFAVVRSGAITLCAILAMQAKASSIVVLGLIPFVIVVTRQRELYRPMLWCGAGVILGMGMRAIAIVHNPYTFGSPLSLGTYLGVQAVAVFTLLSQVLAPLHLSIDPDWEAASFVMQIGCLVLLVTALGYGWRSRSTLIGWLALCLWPRVIVQSGELLHEHHMLIPMLGVSLACARLMQRTCFSQESPCAA